MRLYPLFALFFISSISAQTVGYPPVINFDKKDYSSFLENFSRFKSKYHFKYQNERLDPIACAITQLTYAEKPIKISLNFPQKPLPVDTQTVFLESLKKFLLDNNEIFHSTPSELILYSLTDYGTFYNIIFQRATYGKHHTSGSTRSMIEFVISKKGEISVLVTTLTRKVNTLPDSGSFEKEKIYKRLIGRSFRVSLEGRKIKYLVESPDVIRFAKTCVFEEKFLEDVYDNSGAVIDRKLKRCIVHLAYQFNIELGLSKPLATIYFDAITGEEITVEYPIAEKTI
ncbi:MAG: hypothetical protein SFU91_00515 [Chloroherpetonaceae bacterium]|nr:hypothetical protein [Chloroherpetonaceae bacterium]